MTKLLQKLRKDDVEEFGAPKDSYSLFDKCGAAVKETLEKEEPSWLDKLAFLDEIDTEDFAALYWMGL